MTEFNRILVWGGGAIGGTFAAHLAQAGHDVTVVDVNKAHVETITKKGLAVDLPERSLTAWPKSSLPGDVQGTFDLVLLAVKADKTIEASRQLMSHREAGVPVVSLQNGLCELDLAVVFDAADVVGAFINFGADLIGPGHIRVGNRGAVVVGEPSGEALPRTREIHDLLSLYEPGAKLSGNIFGYLWGKQAYSAVLKASALASDTLINFLEDGRWQHANVTLVREVLNVARAEGVEPLAFDGFDPAAFEAGDVAAAEGLLRMTDLYRGSAKTHSSTWHDLTGKVRNTDAAAQLNPVLKAAERHSIAVPHLVALLAAIRRLEDFEANQDDQTVADWVREAQS